jgi:exo-1,4-beta-D-glucosaminidase
MNNAWPSLIWHLYDYYLRPGSAFYGVLKANQPLHVQYSLDDHSIVVVNSTYSASPQLHVRAQLLSLNSKVIGTYEKDISVEADKAQKVLNIPSDVLPSDSIYFLSLQLSNSHGDVIDNNFYWLSPQKEIYLWPLTDFKQTPVFADADFSALSTLAATQIRSSFTWDAETNKGVVTLENTGTNIAFFLHLRFLVNGEEPLPVFWNDNNISLLPGEKRVLQVYVNKIADKAKLEVQTTGWNTANTSVATKSNKRKKSE